MSRSTTVPGWPMWRSWAMSAARRRWRSCDARSRGSRSWAFGSDASSRTTDPTTNRTSSPVAAAGTRSGTGEPGSIGPARMARPSGSSRRSSESGRTPFRIAVQRHAERRSRSGFTTTTGSALMAVSMGYHRSADWGSAVNNVLRTHS